MFGQHEEIVFIGYPSGLRDEHNSTPLIRRGITASPIWNDFGNDPIFLIDAGVYPGSSGSPVFSTRGYVVGVVWGGPPEGGGRIVYAVPPDRIVAFIPPEKRAIVKE